MSSERFMNLDATRRMTVLVMHSDPPLCAGLVAALHQKSNFEGVGTVGLQPGWEAR
jgi:hypothetical protein